MRNISKRFGPTLALKDVSFQAEAGQVLALIGENGAGKSTLMKILSGAHAPDSGEMQLAGRPYAPSGPHNARLAGVAMIYQELNLAPDLSVEDNIMLGQEVGSYGLLQRRTQHARVREVLDLLGHPELPLATPIRRLSVGAQQLVEIARALVMDAKVIVFDEPTSSLAQQDSQQLFRVIEKLRESGRAVIYISHFLEEIRENCDHYVVLRDGEVVGTGPLDGVDQSELVGLMVGRSVEELFPAVPHEVGETLLSLQELTGVRMPRDVSFELRRGEIFGIAGLVGAGRTELLRTLFALDPVRSGNVSIGGITLPRYPRGRIAAGMGFVSEDRKGEGLAQARSLADNMTLSRLSPYSTAGWLNLRRRRNAVDHWLDRLQVKARSQDQAVQTLSGGNQQKIAIARVMHQEADILLLDEPTRGIDVGTKAEIYRLIGELAARGKAVLFVSSYLPELLAVCDRIGVMGRGRLREVREANRWTEHSVMECAVGSDD